MSDSTHAPRLASGLVLAAAALLACAGAMEGLLRVALFTDVLPLSVSLRLRQPMLYAESDTDDHWKLRSLWQPFRDVNYDPQLGTAAPPTRRNPSARLLPGDATSTSPVVLFYGDSFLTTPAGPLSEQIPQMLEARLGGTPVWNFGMWGHGVDQIVLRFELTHTQFRRPTVMMGILTDDIDRCVLSFREGQKPRFVLQSDATLRLTNVPIDPDRREYLHRNPPEIRSYLFRIVRVALGRSFFARRWPFLGTGSRDQEKRAITKALLERTVKTCRSEALPLAVLIFYPRWELEHETWRGAFLRTALEQLGVPYLDTRDELLLAMHRGSASLDDLYNQTGHHTTRANGLIADAILRRWPGLEIPGVIGDGRPPLRPG